MTVQLNVLTASWDQLAVIIIGAWLEKKLPNCCLPNQTVIYGSSQLDSWYNHSLSSLQQTLPVFFVQNIYYVNIDIDKLLGSCKPKTSVYHNILAVIVIIIIGNCIDTTVVQMAAKHMNS